MINKKILVETISILFVILFVYTAISKIIDFPNFKAIIGQSPIIADLAMPIAILIPILELIVSMLISIPKYKIWGLIGSFSLMFLFTIYIILLVTLSEKIPCSCGGVISMLTWDQHLIFNIFFLLLALLGVFLQSKLNNSANLNAVRVQGSH